MKKYYFPLVLAACFFALIVYCYATIKECPKYYGNSLNLLLENNFYIPKESNICVFEKTMPAGGSGEGWLYAEDDKYYYGVNTENRSRADLKTKPVYFILKKGQESQNFNKFDHKTWDKAEGIMFNPVIK